MDGIPDRVSVVNSISRTTFPGFAYSFRYTADPMPRGVAMSRVMITMYSVFIIFPRIPKVPFVALEAVLELTPGDPTAIQNRMEELKEARITKQPLNYASAGSTFKRPEGYFAGKLIQDAGLSGFSVGDAQVSEKHCGFVINRGEATAADVADLIRKVQEQVYEKFQVKLEPEVRMLGF